MLKILLANDDGLHATGLQTLAEKLSRHHEVYIAAPERQQSAMGHALTLHKPIRVDEVPLPFPVVKAHAISGTPSDCVRLGLKALYKDVKFDLMISGINHGSNLGSDVLYSGTVSAALEAAIMGLPSIAVSLVRGEDKSADFTHTADFIADFIPTVIKVGIPAKSILNINTPAIMRHDFAGVKIVELGNRMYSDTYEPRIDPRGNQYFWLAGEIIEADPMPDSDVEAIRDSMVAVTPVHYDLTNYNALNLLREKFQQEHIRLIGDLPVDQETLQHRANPDV